MNQFPIESRFISYLADNLNAEVSSRINLENLDLSVRIYKILCIGQITLGTITSIEEAIEWLSYTYLFVRMRINPQEYGINYTDVEVILSSLSYVIGKPFLVSRKFSVSERLLVVWQEKRSNWKRSQSSGQTSYGAV